MICTNCDGEVKNAEIPVALRIVGPYEQFAQLFDNVRVM